MREATALAKALDTSAQMKRSFLKPESLLPAHVLYINPDHNGFALWHTPRQAVKLLFADTLGIPSGRAHIPALVWKASKDWLQIFAIKDGEPWTEQTPLYHAPFFNIYENGKVCMGTVRITIGADCQLEEFMKKWEDYFFDSYFSHLIIHTSPVKGNIVQLWQGLVGTEEVFPEKVLIANKHNLKELLK